MGCCYLDSKGRKADSTAMSDISHFRRSNWAVAISLRSLVFLAYSVTMPSMHQFVTNPASPAHEMNKSTLNSHADTVHMVPALGESEAVYAWAVTMYSFGELFGAVLAGPVNRVLPYRLCFLFGALLCPLGYIVYSSAQAGWMVLLARFIIGLNCGFILTFITAYIGETTTELYESQLNDEYSMLELEDAEVAVRSKTKKNKLRDKLYALYSLSGTASTLLPPAIGAVVSYFPSINPYRWTGWFIAATSAIYIAVFLAVFREHKPFHFPTCSFRDVRCCNNNVESCRKGRKGRTSFTLCVKGFVVGLTGSGSYAKVPIIAVLYVCSFVAGGGYAVVDTLVNPVIADHFGFSIGDTTYFILGTTALFLISSVLFLVLKQINVDNRKVYVLGSSLAFCGSLLMADWQGLGNNPCSLPVINTTVLLNNGSFQGYTNSAQVTDLEGESDQSQGFIHEGNSPTSNFPSTSNTTTLFIDDARRCELRSTSDYKCLWNPKSSITGKLCSDCYRICRSKQMSFSFAQFCLGLTLFVVTIPLSTICVTAMLSSLTPLESQGKVMGLNLAFAGVARFVVPIWSDSLYESTSKHTYPPMGLIAAQLLIVLAIFVAIYPKLSPDAWCSDEIRQTDFEMECLEESSSNVFSGSDLENEVENSKLFT